MSSKPCTTLSVTRAIGSFIAYFLFGFMVLFLSLRESLGTVLSSRVKCQDFPGMCSENDFFFFIDISVKKETFKT